MTTLTVNIKGNEWTVKYLTPSQFRRECKIDGTDHAAAYTTVDGTRKIILQKGDATLGIIRHEIAHAIVSEAPILSANLSSEQMEELMCEIVQKDWGLIAKLAEEIVEFIL